MKFCTKCGNKIKDGTVCPYCAYDFKKGTTAENESINRNDQSQELNPLIVLPEEDLTHDTKLTKKSIIVMVLITVLVVAVVVIGLIGNSLSDPRKLEVRFQKDIASNNSYDLASIMYCNDVRLKVDSKSISPLLSYFKSHSLYYDKTIQSLKNDVLSPKNTNSAPTNNLLTLTNVGKFLLVFPSYKIVIKPSFVDITTPVKNVAFLINDVQIGKSDTDNYTKKFGPYMPGDYSISANYKGKYVTLNKSYFVNLVETNSGITKLSAFNDVNYLKITSDFPDAKIFVNGKDVNVIVKDAMNFGPVDSSTKIYATHVVDGKRFKSQEYSIFKGQTKINVSFYNTNSALDNVKTQLVDLLNHCTSSFTEAINTNNFSLINPYIKDGSELYKQQQSYILATSAQGIHEGIVSANITDYNISDDNLYGSITTYEVYNIINKDGVSSNKVFKNIYKFKYNYATSSYQFTYKFV